jgi:hypothetical protein
MASTQYVIDSICSSITVECVYKMIEAFLSQGSFTIADLLPVIQSKDRSLDIGSAIMIAKAALDDMAQHGTLRIEGYNIVAAN